MQLEEIRGLVRDIPDFPKPGIIFKDITPLLGHATAFRRTIEIMSERIPDGVDMILAPEARGFIFGAALAHERSIGFVPVRKPGKLPHDTHGVTYDLEYGTDRVEVHSDAIEPGRRMLLVDDVLATGGTMAACIQLVHERQASVAGCLFLMELTFLEGRARLGDHPIDALIQE